MFAATVVGSPAIIDTEVFNDTDSASLVTNVTSEAKQPEKVLTTEEIVRDYFKDMPILAEVARCESEFRQFNSDGSVLRGDYNKADVGVMQINEKYHLGTAQKLGLNLHTLEGNMAYARYLYEKEGTKPWNYSSACWGKTREVALR